jgi:hypothetical protein
MSDDAIPTAAIITAKNAAGNSVTLKAWFVDKLGTTMGERMFKELVVFVADATKSLPGDPGIALDTKAGRVVSMQSLN